MAPDDLVAFVAAIEIPAAIGPNDGAFHPRGCMSHRGEVLTDVVVTVGELLERTDRTLCTDAWALRQTLERIAEIFTGKIDTRPRWVTAYQPANPTSHGMPIVTAIRALTDWHPLVDGAPDFGVLPSSLVSLAMCRDYTVSGVDDPTLAPWVARCLTEPVLNAFDYVPGEVCMVAARARHQSWPPSRCETFARLVDHEFHGRARLGEAWEEGATEADVAADALEYANELLDVLGDAFDADASAALSIVATDADMSIATALGVVDAVAA